MQHLSSSMCVRQQDLKRRSIGMSWAPRTMNRCSGTAASEPRTGATMKIQRPLLSCETAAGPRLRAGLKEPEEKGLRTKRRMPKVVPTTRGAMLAILERCTRQAY